MEITLASAFLVLLFQLIDESLNDSKWWRIAFYSLGVAATAPPLAVSIHELFTSGRSIKKRFLFSLEKIMKGELNAHVDEKKRRLAGRGIYCNPATLQPTLCRCVSVMALSNKQKPLDWWEERVDDSDVSLTMQQMSDKITDNIKDCPGKSLTAHFLIGDLIIKVIRLINPDSSVLFTLQASYSTGEFLQKQATLSIEEAKNKWEAFCVLFLHWEKNPCCGVTDPDMYNHTVSLGVIFSEVKRTANVYFHIQNGDRFYEDNCECGDLTVIGSADAQIDCVDNFTTTQLIESRVAMEKVFGYNTDLVFNYIKSVYPDKLFELLPHLSCIDSCKLRRKWYPIIGNWKTKRLLSDISFIKVLQKGVNINFCDNIKPTVALLEFLKVNKVVQDAERVSKVCLGAPTHCLKSCKKSRFEGKHRANIVKKNIEIISEGAEKIVYKAPIGEELFKTLKSAGEKAGGFSKLMKKNNEIYVKNYIPAPPKYRAKASDLGDYTTAYGDKKPSTYADVCKRLNIVESKCTKSKIAQSKNFLKKATMEKINEVITHNEQSPKLKRSTKPDDDGFFEVDKRHSFKKPKLVAGGWGKIKETLENIYSYLEAEADEQVATITVDDIFCGVAPLVKYQSRRKCKQLVRHLLGVNCEKLIVQQLKNDGLLKHCEIKLRISPIINHLESYKKHNSGCMIIDIEEKRLQMAQLRRDKKERVAAEALKSAQVNLDEEKRRMNAALAGEIRNNRLKHRKPAVKRPANSFLREPIKQAKMGSGEPPDVSNLLLMINSEMAAAELARMSFEDDLSAELPDYYSKFPSRFCKKPGGGEAHFGSCSKEGFDQLLELCRSLGGRENWKDLVKDVMKKRAGPMEEALKGLNIKKFGRITPETKDKISEFIIDIMSPKKEIDESLRQLTGDEALIESMKGEIAEITNRMTRLKAAYNSAEVYKIYYPIELELSKERIKAVIDNPLRASNYVGLKGLISCSYLKL